MKKINALVVALALAVGAVSTLNAQDLGAPSPAGNPGKWSFTGGYAYSMQTLDLENPVLFPNQGRPEIELKQNRLFLQATRNLGARWDISVRAGVADAIENEYLRFSNVTFINCTGPCGNQGKFSSNATPYAGLTVHGLIWDGEKFGMGTVIQGNSYGRFKDSQSYKIGDPAQDNFGLYESDINSVYDYTVALAMQYKAGRTLIYGGPHAFLTSGHVNWSHTPPMITGYPATQATAKVETEGMLGGYVGMRFPSKGDWMFNAEAQWRYGLMVGFSFTRAF